MGHSRRNVDVTGGRHGRFADLGSRPRSLRASPACPYRQRLKKVIESAGIKAE